MIDMISVSAMIKRDRTEGILLTLSVSVFLLFSVCTGGLAFGGKGATELTPLVVTASRLAPDFPINSRVVGILTARELKKLPVHSLQQALDYVPGVDIKSRNPYGVQGDVSIRGSTFSQVLVLVNGIRVNDPQTGHHNLNFGIPLEQIERIEVLQGPGASFYGADAVGGVINIITRKPTKNSVTFQATRSENNTWDGSGLLSLASKGFYLSATASHNSSSGFHRDTDYRVFNSGAEIGWRGEKNTASITYNYLDKEFGAYDFYTPGLNFPSREWNRAHIVSARGIFHTGLWTLIPGGYYRHHFDEFWLDQDQPDYYENKSETDLYGGNISAKGSFGKLGSVALGVEYQKDRIDSTGLGNHDRDWVSGFGEWGIQRNDRFFFDMGFRLDSYSDYGCEFNPTVSLSFRPLHCLNLRVSAGRSFRVPSYTELYYNSPSNRGNPDLDPEHAWSVEGGLDLGIHDGYTLHLTSFYRKESDIIDWVRYTGNSFWQVVNSGDVEVIGLELGFDLFVSERLSLRAAYDYLDKSIDRGKDYESKYVLNYPRNQFKVYAISSLPYNISMSIALDFQDRVGLGTSTVLDGKLSRKFRNFEIYLAGSNLTDESYQEIPGIYQPGRRLGIGIRISLDF